MEREAVNQWVDVDEVRALAESLMAPPPPSDVETPDSVYGDSFEGFVGGDGESIKPPQLRSPQQLGSTQPQPAPTAGPVPIAPPAGAPAAIHQSHHKPTQPQPSRPSPLAALKLKNAPQALRPPSRTKEVEEPIPAQPVKHEVVHPPVQIAEKQISEKPAPQPLVPAPVVEKAAPLPLAARLQTFGTWLKSEMPTQAYFICDRHGEVIVDEVGSEKLIKVARTLAHASSSAVRQVGEAREFRNLHVKVGPERVMEVIPRHSHFGLVVLGVIVPRPLSQDAVISVSKALGSALSEQ